MTIELEIQRATRLESVPNDDAFALWVKTALQERDRAALVIRVVDRDESRRLNGQFRGKDSATNVLSFQADVPPEIGLSLLGDVVICAPVVEAEAAAQRKPPREHWAHLTIHGVLHLLGYDHQKPAQAREMEELEISMLASVGIADPYIEREA